MINNFVHINIGVKDLEKTKDFYSAIFNWRIYEIPEMTDILFFEIDKEGDSVEGGFALTEEPINPGSIVLYVNVDDIDSTLDKVKTLKGEVVLEKTKLPGGFGIIARFKDINGNIMGLWTEDK
jgi:predicted enzyme related to lactoylglutathione lyase